MKINIEMKKENIKCDYCKKNNQQWLIFYPNYTRHLCHTCKTIITKCLEDSGNELFIRHAYNMREENNVSLPQVTYVEAKTLSHPRFREMYKDIDINNKIKRWKIKGTSILVNHDHKYDKTVKVNTSDKIWHIIFEENMSWIYDNNNSLIAVGNKALDDLFMIYKYSQSDTPDVY